MRSGIGAGLGARTGDRVRREVPSALASASSWSFATARPLLRYLGELQAAIHSRYQQ